MATGRVPTTANSPLTAKGDLFGYSTTQARVAVGNDGETLVADSSTSTGLRYQASMAAGRNGCIGGGFDIWQRGTGPFTLSAASFVYTADRWFTARSAGTSGVTASQVTNTTLDGFRYALRIQRTAADTSTGINYLMSNFETANSIPFANKTVTLSFYARAGANYSATSNALVATVRLGTGTDQSGFTSGWTGSANVLQQTATLTTSWQRFTYTATVASTATQLGIQFDFTPTGTAGANDWFDITGVQLELGSVATTFTRSGGTLQGELAACQRYYWLFNSGSSSILGTTFYQSASRIHIPVLFPVTMRVAPSLSATSGTNYYNFQTSGDDNFNSLTIGAASPQSAYLFNTTEVSGTAGQAGMTLTNNASTSVAFSAEL